MSVTNATELLRMSAAELAAAIRSRQASSQDIVEAHLRRITEVNAAVNAVTVVLTERALEAAKAADRATVAGDELSPFHGVPFTIKANIDLAGTPTTPELKSLAGAYPVLDAPSVQRLRTAGAIPIGRTDLPNLAVRWHTDSVLWGATMNPWNRRKTPGASSGGEAEALTTGMGPLGLGRDGLGSLRWPAQCCGLATLKPTPGRIPDASSVEASALMPIGAQLTVVVGPMARLVADLRTAFEVLAGPSWRDPWTVRVPLRGPAPARPVRVAPVIDPVGQGTAKQVRDGIRKAGRALTSAPMRLSAGRQSRRHYPIDPQ